MFPLLIAATLSSAVVSIDLTVDQGAAMKEAEKALRMKPVSVIDKKVTPDSGDKHDYMSMGPYWWPDPKKPDGLPFIRKDGQKNPQTRNGDATDSPRFSRLAGASAELARAWHITKDERFAKHASHLLRTWFIDPKTRMNPNLNFGQAVPGRTKGRGIGIIDSRVLIEIADAAELISTSSHWTKTDQPSFQKWCRDYLDWLLTSPHGKEEAAMTNNHGTWYDAQVVRLALFVGDNDLAKKTLEAAKDRRFSHIKPDGSQPNELKRTRSYDYSVFNLQALCLLAKMGEQVGVDLWNYPDGKNPAIKRAFDYIEQHLQTWAHPQIKKLDPGKLKSIRRLIPD